MVREAKVDLAVMRVTMNPSPRGCPNRRERNLIVIIVPAAMHRRDTSSKSPSCRAATVMASTFSAEKARRGPGSPRATRRTWS